MFSFSYKDIIKQIPEARPKVYVDECCDLIVEHCIQLQKYYRNADKLIHLTADLKEVDDDLERRDFIKCLPPVPKLPNYSYINPSQHNEERNMISTDIELSTGSIKKILSKAIARILFKTGYTDAPINLLEELTNIIGDYLKSFISLMAENSTSTESLTLESLEEALVLMTGNGTEQFQNYFFEHITNFHNHLFLKCKQLSETLKDNFKKPDIPVIDKKKSSNITTKNPNFPDLDIQSLNTLKTNKSVLLIPSVNPVNKLNEIKNSSSNPSTSKNNDISTLIQEKNESLKMDTENKQSLEKLALPRKKLHLNSKRACNSDFNFTLLPCNKKPKTDLLIPENKEGHSLSLDSSQTEIISNANKLAFASCHSYSPIKDTTENHTLESSEISDSSSMLNDDSSYYASDKSGDETDSNSCNFSFEEQKQHLKKSVQFYLPKNTVDEETSSHADCVTKANPKISATNDELISSDESSDEWIDLDSRGEQIVQPKVEKLEKSFQGNLNNKGNNLQISVTEALNLGEKIKYSPENNSVLHKTIQENKKLNAFPTDVNPKSSESGKKSVNLCSDSESKSSQKSAQDLNIQVENQQKVSETDVRYMELPCQLKKSLTSKIDDDNLLSQSSPDSMILINQINSRIGNFSENEEIKLNQFSEIKEKKQATLNEKSESVCNYETFVVSKALKPCISDDRKTGSHQKKYSNLSSNSSPAIYKSVSSCSTLNRKFYFRNRKRWISSCNYEKNSAFSTKSRFHTKLYKTFVNKTSNLLI